LVNHCKGRGYAQKSKTKNVIIYNHITYKSINIKNSGLTFKGIMHNICM
jgi:hypothetical protein